MLTHYKTRHRPSLLFFFDSCTRRSTTTTPFHRHQFCIAINFASKTRFPTSSGQSKTHPIAVSITTTVFLLLSTRPARQPQHIHLFFDQAQPPRRSAQQINKYSFFLLFLLFDRFFENFLFFLKTQLISPFDLFWPISINLPLSHYLFSVFYWHNIYHSPPQLWWCI